MNRTRPRHLANSIRSRRRRPISPGDGARDPRGHPALLPGLRSVESCLNYIFRNTILRRIRPFADSCRGGRRPRVSSSAGRAVILGRVRLVNSVPSPRRKSGLPESELHRRQTKKHAENTARYLTGAAKPLISRFRSSGTSPSRPILDPTAPRLRVGFSPPGIGCDGNPRLVLLKPRQAPSMDSFARTAGCGAHRRTVADPAVGSYSARRSMRDPRQSILKGPSVRFPEGRRCHLVPCFLSGFLSPLSLPFEE